MDFLAYFRDMFGLGRPGQVPMSHWVLFTSVVVVLAASFYKYMWTKDYAFLIEAPCDSTQDICFVRDCENDYCPPNGLGEYKTFSLPASVFSLCIDNACSTICPSEKYQCVEILCDAENGDACSELQGERQ